MYSSFLEKHVLFCYTSQTGYAFGACQLITLGSNGIAPLTAGPGFEYANGVMVPNNPRVIVGGRVNSHTSMAGVAVEKLSSTTAVLCFRDRIGNTPDSAITRCRRLQILDVVAGTIDFADAGPMNMCAGHNHLGM